MIRQIDKTNNNKNRQRCKQFDHKDILFQGEGPQGDTGDPDERQMIRQMDRQTEKQTDRDVSSVTSRRFCFREKDRKATLVIQTKDR